MPARMPDRRDEIGARGIWPRATPGCEFNCASFQCLALYGPTGSRVQAGNISNFRDRAVRGSRAAAHPKIQEYFTAFFTANAPWFNFDTQVPRHLDRRTYKYGSWMHPLARGLIHTVSSTSRSSRRALKLAKKMTRHPVSTGMPACVMRPPYRSAVPCGGRSTTPGALNGALAGWPY